MKTERLPVDIWMEFLTEGPLGVCGLCGNSGRVKRGAVRTPTGTREWRPEAFCICPNGRKWKQVETKKLREI